MSEMPPVPQMPMASDVNDNDKLMALLAYLLTPLVPIIVLVSDTMKVRPYQNYHALQALGLVAAEFIASILLCVVFAICTVLTLGIGSLLYCLLFVVFIPQIYYGIVAYSSPKYFEIPFVTQFMTQQGWLKRPM